MSKPGFVCCQFLDKNNNILHRACVAYRDGVITIPDGFFNNSKVSLIRLIPVNSCSECKDL